MKMWYQILMVRWYQMADGKTRNDFQQVVHAKRKYGLLEIIGNLIIWLAPIILFITILFIKWDSLWKQSTGIHLEVWMSLVLIVMIFVYLKWGRRKIHERYVADNARSEKHPPLLVLCNSLLNLAPFGIIIMLIDILNSIGEQLNLFVLILLIIEAVGRILLFIDSFKEEEYK